MTAMQRIRVRRSEHREKVNALLGIEERTPEQEAELRERTGKLQALEVEYRAADRGGGGGGGTGGGRTRLPRLASVWSSGPRPHSPGSSLSRDELAARWPGPKRSFRPRARLAGTYR